MSTKTSKKKVTASEVISAVVAGASYNFGIEAMGKKVDFVNKNYMVTKSLSAAVIGSGLLYFSDRAESKAAGFALMGVAGASAAAKISTIVVESGDPVNGRRNKSLNGTLKNVLTKLSANKGVVNQKPQASVYQKPSSLNVLPYKKLALMNSLYGSCN